MNPYAFAVAIALFPLAADSSELCYQHYDKNSQPINIGRKPPFDMSGPPFSSAYQAARDRGEYIVISPSDKCSMPENLRVTPVETVKSPITPNVAPRTSFAPSTPHQSNPSPVRSMTVEEYNEYRRQNPAPPFPRLPQTSPPPASDTSTYQPNPPVTSRSYSSPQSGGGGKGCGSRGGPGYRLPNGKCASWKD